MPRLSKWPFTKMRLALAASAVLASIGLVALVLWARGSPEERAQRYYAHAVKLLEQHEDAKASIELRNAVRLKRDMLPAWRSLAQVEEGARHWDGVVESLRSVVQLDPSDIEARIKLAKLLLVSGSARQALTLTDAGIQADTQNARLLGLKAAILYRLNDNAKAIAQAQGALVIDPSNVDAVIVLATDRMAKDDAKGALRILESEPVRKVADLGIQLFKLKIFEQLGESQKVESQLRSLITLHPEVPAFRQLLIKFYVDQHREDDAEHELRARVAENAADADAELELVHLLYSAKGPPQAKQELVARIKTGGEVFPYQIALAQLDFAQGNFADAEQLMQVLVSHPSSPEQALTAQVKLAEMYLKQNKVDDAEALVTEILREDNRNTDGLKLRASVRIARGQLEVAISDLRQALNDRPQSTELMLMLGLAYERSGSIELAEKQYSDAVRVSNYDPVVGLDYVGFLQRRGSPERAEQVLTELSKRSPVNLDILSALAQIKLARQDWAGAETVAESMRHAGDPGGVANQILGAALSGQHKYDESIAVLQSSVDAAPSSVQPLASLVRTLVNAQKADRAIAVLQSTLRANPNEAEALALLGSVQLDTGTPDLALKSFKAAIEKQPQNIVGYRALAELYISQKKYDEALATIRSGLQAQPDSEVLHLALASALEKAGRYEAAITEYESLLSRQPGSMIIANNLASLLSDHRDDKASLDRAQSLAEALRKSQVPQFKDTLGWVSYRRGDYGSAITLLEEAAAATPNVALVHYHLAMACVALKQAAKAAEQLKSARSLAPDSELEQKIQDALKKLAT